MAKIGLSVNIDVTKIDKARLFKGEKGTYLNLTTFIETGQADQYGNNGFISQSVSREERAAGIQTPILGNVKVVYTEPSQAVQQTAQSLEPTLQHNGGFQEPNDPFDDGGGSIPF